MRKKYFDYFEKFTRDGVVTALGTETGLCPVIGYDDPLLRLFKPNENDLKNFKGEVNIYPDNGKPKFWASGEAEPKRGKFTEMRQNIVLFLAAMNNEL